MIILDTALERCHEDGTPVRVGIVGAGYLGRGMALQILSSIPGMRVVAISNRTLAKAEQAYGQAGVESVVCVESVSQLEDAISKNRYAITEDAQLLCEANGIDVIIEATGTLEFAAKVVLNAIEHGKHVVLMNAELDGTLGPILKVRADRAGVVYTNADGDQPGVVMNLFRFVKTIGYDPVLVGNIKGMLDEYRTPETQRAFAEKHKQEPKMVTSFADGTKLSMEQAVIANATGFKVSKRGMHGPACDHVQEALDLFDLDELLDGGRVDYILGAEPGPGVFVIGYNDNPILRQYGTVYKMGEGPLYVFYVPYHLPHLEGPLSAARAELFRDAAIAPKGGPVCEVITVAKRDLAAGEVLDGMGGFLSYGVIDNADVCRRENLLPMGLAEDCVLRHDVAKDQPLAFDDVTLPENRLIDDLWNEQSRHFAPNSARSLASDVRANRPRSEDPPLK
jgi:predicted homoserine dehydrogenase-like protein